MTDWDQIWAEASLAARKWRNHPCHDDMVQIAAISLHATEGQHLGRRRMIARRRIVDFVRQWQGKRGSHKAKAVEATCQLDYQTADGLTVVDDPCFSVSDWSPAEFVDWVRSVWPDGQQQIVAAGVAFGLPRHDIALDYLGVTPGRVSQLLGRMRGADVW